MPNRLNYSQAIIVTLCLIVALTGCGTSAMPADDGIEPVTALEEENATPADETPTAEATLRTELADSPSSEATLPTELDESTSPLVPTPTQEAPIAAMNESNIQPLPGSDDVLALVLADLAEKTGLPPDQITLTEMEATNWSDASLGCPQEGMMYAQVITPGYLMRFEAGGQAYEYHTDETRSFVLCDE